MRARILTLGLSFLLTAGAISLHAADKDEAKKNKETAAVKKERLTVIGALRARIQEIDGKTLKLVVTEQIPEVMASRFGRRSIAYDITIREQNTELEVTMIEGVKVRLPLKPERDAKGRPKPVKKDPKDPDRNLPGMKGELKDLEVGQSITVSLARSHEKQPRIMAVMVVIEE